MPTNGNGMRKQQRSKPPCSNAPLMSDEEQVAQQALAQECMEYEWAHNPRWKGVERPYTAEDVMRLRGSIHITPRLDHMREARSSDLFTSES